MAVSKTRRCLMLFLVLFIPSCSNQRFDYSVYVEQHNLQSFWLDGQGYRHWLVFKPGHVSDVLRVYLSGDGSPWLYGRYVNDDPTPAQPVALRLMGLDPSPALYLGRPCYHGLELACDPSLWTDRRYSKEVVDSMTSSLKRFLDQKYGGTIKRLELIGYSGGGALAVLLAERLEAVSTVITLAGNLDHQAWTESFSYLPLTDSLNPMNDAELNGVSALHIVGSEDKNIKPEFVEAFVKKHGGELLVLEKVDHSCCWMKNWPDLLKKIDRLH